MMPPAEQEGEGESRGKKRRVDIKEDERMGDEEGGAPAAGAASSQGSLGSQHARRTGTRSGGGVDAGEENARKRGRGP